LFPSLPVACPEKTITLLPYSCSRPYFSILNGNGVASHFLEAVAAGTGEALSFVSKNYIKSIDLDALRDMLGFDTAETAHQTLNRSLATVRAKASFNRDPKNCLTSSVVMLHPEHGVMGILHLHMIKEPDGFGQWKIYGYEQE